MADSFFFNVEPNYPPGGARAGGINARAGGNASARGNYTLRNGTLPYGSGDDSQNTEMGIIYSILIYAALMALVLLPLTPCCRCDEDYQNTKRYIKKRKKQIQKEIVTKKVQEHVLGTLPSESFHEEFEIGVLDDYGLIGGLCKQSDDLVTVPTEDEELSLGSTDSNKLLCSICLEPLLVGEVVSWSTNQKCGHVFHTVCISQWLLKHDDCPVCRDYFMHGDEDLPKGTSRLSLCGRRKCTCDVIYEAKQKQQEDRKKCQYCVNHGLVLPSDEEAFEIEVDDCKENYEEEGKIKADKKKAQDIDIEAGKIEGQSIKLKVAKCPVHGSPNERAAHRRNHQSESPSDLRSSFGEALWNRSMIRYPGGGLHINYSS